MVKLTRNPSGRPHPVEANITDVDLPGVVNYGIGRDEVEAIADFKQKAAEYICSLEQADYTVLRG